MSDKKLLLGRYDFAGFSAFIMYSICSFSIPLLIVGIGRELDFPIDDGGMSSGGGLHMIRSGAMMITLLICGWLAALWGKRVTMGSSIIMLGLGMLCCAFSQAYWMLLPGLLIAGLGEGVCEGIATPFVQDLHPNAPERYVNIAHSFWSVGTALAVLVSGGLLALGVNWRVILGVIGVLTLLSSLGFLWKENPRRPYPESGTKIDFRSIMKQSAAIVAVPRFWRCCLAMFFGAGAEFGLTFWSAAYIELNFRTGAWVAGLGTGVIALGMFTGRTIFGYYAKPGYLRYILLLSSLLTIPLTIILALLKPGMMPDAMLFTLLFTLLFACGVGIAPYWPTTQVYGVNAMPELDSTLLYVYFSAMGIPGCGFFTWLMGVTGDRWGLTGAIMVVPCCLLIFAAMIFIECWLLARRKPQLAANGQ